MKPQYLDVMGDNFHFDITGAPLKKCLDIAFSDHPKTIGWAIRKLESGETLVLYWADKKDINKFPCALTAEQVQPMIEQWLKTADYGPEPDHDGCNEKSWRVFNDNWSRVGHEFESFVGIQTNWMMYGK